MPTEKQKEEYIEADICQFLILKGASLDKIISEGYYDKNKGFYRKRKSNFTSTGISDIIGVYEGMYFAIEVKTPEEIGFFDRSLEELKERFLDTQRKVARDLRKDSTLKKYQHAIEQRAFLDDKVRAGGIAFFASSIEEVKEGFKEFNVIL